MATATCHRVNGSDHSVAAAAGTHRPDIVLLKEAGTSSTMFEMCRQPRLHDTGMNAPPDGSCSCGSASDRRAAAP